MAMRMVSMLPGSRGRRANTVFLILLGLLAVATGACRDILTSPAARPRVQPIPLRKTIGPPDSTAYLLGIDPGNSVTLPPFAYSTWIEVTITGAIELHSLVGSRTTLNGPVYARGVWSQNTQCGLNDTISYPTASMIHTPTCGEGPITWVDTIPARGAGHVTRGQLPWESTGACGVGVACHWVTGEPQDVKVKVFPVTLDPLKVAPHMINFATVPYAYVQFIASRTPATFTKSGNTTGMPITFTSWTYQTLDGTVEPIWAYCAFPSSNLLCTPSLHTSGRMTAKAFAGGWEQTSSVTVQCPESPADLALNDTLSDFLTRRTLLASLDSANVDSAAGAGYDPQLGRGFRHEVGGIIWQMPNGSFQPIFYPDPNATECRYTPPAVDPVGPPGALPVAYFHAHTVPAGEPVYGCLPTRGGIFYERYPGDTIGRQLAPLSKGEANGGGSGDDWGYARYKGRPVWVIHNTRRVYRLNPMLIADTLHPYRWDPYKTSGSPKCRWVR